MNSSKGDRIKEGGYHFIEPHHARQLLFENNTGSANRKVTVMSRFEHLK